MKPERKKFPRLYRAWNDYGHSVEWGDLFDYRHGRHGFIALAWMEDGQVNYATLSDVGGSWEMQNDSHDTIPLAQWRRMRVKPQCDWLEEKTNA